MLDSFSKYVDIKKQTVLDAKALPVLCIWKKYAYTHLQFLGFRVLTVWNQGTCVTLIYPHGIEENY